VISFAFDGEVEGTQQPRRKEWKPVASCVVTPKLNMYNTFLGAKELQPM
jgi:hypothetical protein